MDKVFQTLKTKAGSTENIEQLHDWLKENSKVWLVEFQKLSDGRW